jgi:hypothetical protein
LYTLIPRIRFTNRLRPEVTKMAISDPEKARLVASAIEDEKKDQD